MTADNDAPRPGDMRLIDIVARRDQPPNDDTEGFDLVSLHIEELTGLLGAHSRLHGLSWGPEEQEGAIHLIAAEALGLSRQHNPDVYAGMIAALHQDDPLLKPHRDRITDAHTELATSAVKEVMAQKIAPRLRRNDNKNLALIMLGMALGVTSVVSGFLIGRHGGGSASELALSGTLPPPTLPPEVAACLEGLRTPAER
jgi:hypothetical protein